MGKQLNSLEKEFLIRTYRAKTDVKLSDFCRMNDVSDSSMRKWMKQYDEGGLEGLTKNSEMSGFWMHETQESHTDSKLLNAISLRTLLRPPRSISYNTKKN